MGFRNSKIYTVNKKTSHNWEVSQCARPYIKSSTTWKPLHCVFSRPEVPVVSPVSPGQRMGFGFLAWMVAQEGVKKLVLSARGRLFLLIGCRRTLYLQEKSRPCRLTKFSWITQKQITAEEDSHVVHVHSDCVVLNLLAYLCAGLLHGSGLVVSTVFWSPLDSVEFNRRIYTNDTNRSLKHCPVTAGLQRVDLLKGAVQKMSTKWCFFLSYWELEKNFRLNVTRFHLTITHIDGNATTGLLVGSITLTLLKHKYMYEHDNNWSQTLGGLRLAEFAVSNWPKLFVTVHQDDFRAFYDR